MTVTEPIRKERVLDHKKSHILLLDVKVKYGSL